MPGLFDQIDAFVAKHDLIPEGSTIVVGLSGGPDSVLLLVYLAQLLKQGKVSQLIAAHLDHEWRVESDQDSEFCRELSQQHGAVYVTQKISELSFSHKFNGSREASARAARRFFLESVQAKFHAQAIALGHHLQDQEETFFIRLVRGTSLSGLSCMWPKRNSYIRPLLEVNKADIVRYLEQLSIPFLFDPTNQSPEFLRNRIRATVLPALQKCDPRFDANFLATINRLQQTEQFLQKITQQTLAQISEPLPGESADQSTQKSSVADPKQALKLKSFLELNLALAYRVLLAWLIENGVPFTPSQALLEEILRFMRQPHSGSHIIAPSWHLHKRSGLLWIARGQAS